MHTLTRDFSSLSLKLLFQNGFLHLVAVFCVFVCLNYLLSLLALHCLFLWVLKVEHLLLCTVVVTRTHIHEHILTDATLLLQYQLCCECSDGQRTVDLLCKVSHKTLINC